MKKLLMTLTLVGAAVVGKVQAMERAQEAGKLSRLSNKHIQRVLTAEALADYALYCLATGEGEHPQAEGFKLRFKRYLTLRSASSTDTSRTTTPDSERSDS